MMNYEKVGQKTLESKLNIMFPAPWSGRYHGADVTIHQSFAFIRKTAI